MPIAMRTTSLVLLLCAAVLASSGAQAADKPPHGQSKVPGPALSAQEAMAKMELPPGFKVTLCAGEPDIVNPTAMTFDDRGRIWICESLEYPRRQPGPGKDRVKILEDTDGDGRYEKVTVFKDGLNIPCGVAIGNGGVYITNSPDVLFLKDTDGDDKADTQEVLFTGFGRDDTHELPNNLMFGPDGWLYGMNGVFNQSKVKDPASDKVYSFTCAIWRYHPATKKFELFSEGTSNPWGLDYNRQGDWFLSCCVIDHLFHMTQSGYYLRQGGPYPPNVQMAKLPSITTKHHQQAAYAGLCIYDADVFPEEYRGRLIMGNLHGSALNQDVLSKNGSTYTQTHVKDEAANAKQGDGMNDGKGGMDFLQANDAWFMPVAQRLGPDGCLFVMDWYDRYHCYQDANRDSPGLDRLKGRIYRISYENAPLVKPFDLRRSSRQQLLKLLEHPNVWWRRTASRILNEKFEPALVPTLQKMALDSSLENNAHMHALWLLVSQNALDEAFHLKVLTSADAAVRNWGVRAVGNAGKASPTIYAKLKEMAASDPSPDVRVQIAVAAGRLEGGAAAGNDPLPLLMTLLADPGNAKDPLIPTIVYLNLRPMAGDRGKDILAALDKVPGVEQAFGATTVRWVKQAIASSGRGVEQIVADVKKTLNDSPDVKKAGQALVTLIDSLGYLPLEDRAKAVDKDLRETVLKYAGGDDAAVRVPAITIALWWRDAKAVEAARDIVADNKTPAEVRVALLRALSESGVPGGQSSFAMLASDANAPMRLRQVAIDALGSMGRKPAADSLVAMYKDLPIDLKPIAVLALTRNAVAAEALLDALENKHIPVADVTASHVRQINAMNQAKLSERLRKAWGTVRSERDPERTKIVEQMRKVVEGGQGNATAGWKVFQATCAQCHTIYGHGGNVGPDITGVGREDLNSVLTNVIDPNLVIGSSYYTHIARIKDGDTVSGLLVEDSPNQVVLKDQTKTHVIPRDKLEKLTVQEISVMPEGLEKNMEPQAFRDLVAFLLTREPPAGGPPKDVAPGSGPQPPPK